MQTNAIRLGLLIAGFFTAADALAQRQTPTDMDLRAAYCRPVIAGAINRFAQDAAAQQQHADAVQRGRRIELYILPRLSVVEPKEVLAAQARGRDDTAKLNELLSKCRAKCPESDAKARAACVRQCTSGDEATKRTRDCDNLAWLPLQESKP